MGPTGRPTCSWNWPSASDAAGARGGGHGRQLAAEHCGPPDEGGGNVERPRHCVGHHAEQRALSQVATQQPAQERLLPRGGGGEHGTE